MKGLSFANDYMEHPKTIEIRSFDDLSSDLEVRGNPVVVDKVKQIWKLQCDSSKPVELKGLTGTKPIINLGAIPEGWWNYQPDTVLQWGHKYQDLILLLRIGVKAEGIRHIDLQNNKGNTYLFDCLIDFLFK